MLWKQIINFIESAKHFVQKLICNVMKEIYGMGVLLIFETYSQECLMNAYVVLEQQLIGQLMHSVFFIGEIWKY